jgi:hypothetical protein
MAEAADLRLITGRPPLLTLTHEDMFPRRVSTGFFFLELDRGLESIVYDTPIL